MVNSFICGRILLDRTYMYFHFFSERGLERGFERGREEVESKSEENVV